MTTTLKTGKLPARHDPKNLSFAAFREPQVAVSVPHSFGHYELVHEWGMLGNDEAGDCVWAGADHEEELWNAIANAALSQADRRLVTFTTENALSDYSAVTGYNPNDPNTDQGTDVSQALSYRRHTGVIDAAGTRHKIGAYVELEPGNYEHVIEAAYLFGVVGIGIQFPVSAMDQFNAGKPWTVVKGASVEGGHYIPLVGRRGSYLDIVTWGKVQRMTKTFFERYCDEAFAILSPEFLVNGKSPEGFDLAGLKAQLAELKKPGSVVQTEG